MMLLGVTGRPLTLAREGVPGGNAGGRTESSCVSQILQAWGRGLSGKTPASFADIIVGGLLLTKSW